MRVIALFIILSLYACSGIFVPDPIDPRIPKYTEEGNNVAGAFVNDQIWKSVVKYGFMSVNDPIVTYYSSLDSLAIEFHGEFVDTGQPYIFSFGFSNVVLNKKSDIVSLRDKKFQLDGVNNKVSIEFNNCQVIESGQFYIKNVAVVSDIDFIISGTFSFKTNDVPCGNMNATFGRFDYYLTSFYFN